MRKLAIPFTVIFLVLFPFLINAAEKPGIEFPHYELGTASGVLRANGVESLEGAFGIVLRPDELKPFLSDSDIGPYLLMAAQENGWNTVVFVFDAKAKQGSAVVYLDSQGSVVGFVIGEAVNLETTDLPNAEVWRPVTLTSDEGKPVSAFMFVKDLSPEEIANTNAD